MDDNGICNRVLGGSVYMKIYKYPLDLADQQTISMPEGAEMLSIGQSRDQIILWVMADPAAALRDYVFRIVGTGNEVPDGLQYLGTVQQSTYAWHIFLEVA